MAKFADVLRIINGRNQKAVENPSGIYPIYGSGGIIGYADDYICEANTVVLGRKGSINNPIFVETCFWNVDTAFGLQADTEKLNPKYLYYFCESFNFERLSTTVTIPSLTKANLLQIEIPLPPLDEQRRIAVVLDKVSDLIAKRRQQLEKLDELVKARFVEMFGDPMENPNGYRQVKLSEVATYFNGLTYKPESVATSGTIVLRSCNIQNNQLDFSDIARVNMPIRDKLIVKENDILMCSRNGSPKLVGKVALIKRTQEPMSFGAFMMIIRSRFYRYLMTYFGMEVFRRQIRTGETTTINQITGKMLNDVVIPLPPQPLIEKFTAVAERVEKQMISVGNSLKRLTTLKKALIQAYFG